MATFADSLKREIARVARKELKGEIAALRASLALQRSEISGLKKQLATFQAEIKRLARARAKQDLPKQARPIEPRPVPEVTRSRPGGSQGSVYCGAPEGPTQPARPHTGADGQAAGRVFLVDLEMGDRQLSAPCISCAGDPLYSFSRQARGLGQDRFDR